MRTGELLGKSDEMLWGGEGEGGYHPGGVTILLVGFMLRNPG